MCVLVLSGHKLFPILPLLFLCLCLFFVSGLRSVAWLWWINMVRGNTDWGVHYSAVSQGHALPANRITQRAAGKPSKRPEPNRRNTNLSQGTRMQLFCVCVYVFVFFFREFQVVKICQLIVTCCLLL